MCPAKTEFKLAAADLHRQDRSRQPRQLVVFLIDTSDSMGDGTTARMTLALSAIVSIAAKAYLSRDRVCLITFRDREAQLIVPPTDSVMRVKQQLHRLPVGGATPLSAGLLKARQVICQVRAKNQSVEPLLVLISDGEATVPIIKGADPSEEALAVASLLRKERVSALVICSQPLHLQQSFMPRLAEELGTTCQSIHNLGAGQVLGLIEQSVSKRPS